MSQRHEGPHFSKLSDLQKRAIDDQIKAVLTDQASIDFTRKRDPSCNIVHPDEYRDAMREFFACNSVDVDEIEQRYKEKLRQERGITGKFDGQVERGK
jgi:hypothetical protein